MKYLFYRIFENIDFKEENGENENKTEQTCEDNKSTYRILNHYREACKINSAISFEDFLQNYQPGMLHIELL